MDEFLKIYQIYFERSQMPFLEKEFIPFDASKVPNPENREYRIFHRSYTQEKHKESLYTGFISWKFYEKTQIRGKEFIQFIQKNPGYDVYFINPFWEEIFWQNVWLQGESKHPGLIVFVQRILEKLGHEIDLRTMHNDISNLSYCNYWVGNRKFWDEYIRFTLPLYNHLLYDLSPEDKNFMVQQADRRIKKCGYLPFIMERMFSTFLVTHPSIKALAYTYSWDQLEKKYNKFIGSAIKLVIGHPVSQEFKNAILESIQEQNAYVDCIEKSYSYRIGRAITFPMRYLLEIARLKKWE